MNELQRRRLANHDDIHELSNYQAGQEARLEGLSVVDGLRRFGVSLYDRDATDAFQRGYDTEDEDIPETDEP